MNDTASELNWSPNRSIRTHVVLALAAVFFLFASVVTLSMTVSMSGAVVAPGSVIFDNHFQSVQHPSGGVVGEILVHEGSRVKAGDLLMRLDPTLAAASLGIITKGQEEMQARQTRLEAERDGSLNLLIPDALALAAEQNVGLKKLLDGERHVFEDRHSSREGERRQLIERISQIEQQIDGVELQVAAKSDELALIADELAGVKQLYAKSLVPIQRVTSLEREKARLNGERGELIASVAQARGRISETELQMLQIGRDLQTEVSAELIKIQTQSAELAERRIAAEDQLKRVDIFAPQDGVIQQLSIHTVGGVIGPGATLMEIMPETDPLVVEAKVALSDIDQVWLDQQVILRLSAFNQRTTPEFVGKVSLVPADLTTDTRTGVQYYSVRIKLDAESLPDGEKLRLVPGMPVECFIQTGDRSVVSYFVKPLSDQMRRAFKHE